MALQFLYDGYFAGKVGIGIETPTTLLHLDQPSNDRDGGLYIERNSSNYGLSMFVNSGGYGVIGSNGTFTTDILTLDLNSGNVGIGEDAPGTLLSLKSPLANTSIVTLKCSKNDSSWTIGDRIGGINFFGEDGSGQGAGIKGSINYIVASSSGGSNAMTFNVAGTANNQERMRIDNAGNVGIGTDDPDYELQVGDGTATETINIKAVSTNPSRIFFSDNNDIGQGRIHYEHGGDYMNFWTDGAERMRIDSAGAIKFNAYDSTNNTGTPTYMLGTDGSGNVVKVLGADIPGVPAGSGTLNTVTMWTPDGDTLGNAPITISGNNSTFAGNITVNGNTTLGDNTSDTHAISGYTSIIRNTAVTIGTTDSNNQLLIENTHASGSALLRMRGGDGAAKILYGENNSTDKFYITPRNDTTKDFTLDQVGNATFAGTVDINGAGNNSIAGDLYFGANADIFKSSGDLTLDVAGDIVLDADGGDVVLRDNGTSMGRLGLENGDLNLAAAQQDYDIRLKGNDGGTIITALHLDMSEGGNATFSTQAFATVATSTGDASSTLTTKGYVDGLITGATIYRGTWQAGISATSTGTTTASTTLTVSAAILDAAGNTPTLVGAVVTGAGITGTVKVSSVTSSTVYVLDTAIDATATAYIFSPIYGAPDLSGVTQTSGYYYICSEAGSATPNGAGTEPNTWGVGDWVIWNDDVGASGEWQKVDNSSVLSGAGTGQTVALWEGPSSVTDSETLGNAPITVIGNNTTFAGVINLSSNKSVAWPGGSIRAEGNTLKLVATTLIDLQNDTKIQGDLTIEKSTPKLTFNNLAGGGLDPSLTASGTNFTISTSSITPLTMALDTGNATFAGTVKTQNTSASAYPYFAIEASAKEYHIGVGGASTVSGYANNLYVYDNTAAAIRMVIDTSGKVGIGVDDPDAKLEIKGTGGTSGLTFKTTDASSNEIFFIQDGGRTGVRYYPLTIGQASGTSPATGARFQVSTTANDFVVLNDSSTGIGTITPQSKLQVVGGIQMADDTATASAAKAGTMRYRTGTEYVEDTGKELITDGDFASSTYWGGTNAAVASGVATFTGTSGQESTLFQQNIAIVTTSGTLHALTYTVVSNNLQGSAAFYAGFRTNNECIQKQFIPMTVGTHTVYANSVGTGNGFSLHTSVGFTSGTLVIDNVSVYAVTAEDASYADMCMQTGSSTYEWVNIVRNTY